MKIISVNIPTILFLLFEVAVGILLLTDPEGFTRTVIICFGIILLVVGITCLLTYLRRKKENINDILSFMIAVITLICGIVCTFFSGAIISLIAAIAIVYGLILAVSGCYKLHNYFQIKKLGVPVSMISILSGVFAIVIGLIIVMYPKNAAFSVWQLAGIMLIIEAVIDLISIIQVVKIKNNLR